MRTNGFFNLKTPRDLMNKVEHDYAGLKAAPLDSYAAFDFFVTATALYDCVKQSNMPAPMWDGRDAATFRLCGDVGNGAKHFVMAENSRRELPSSEAFRAGGRSKAAERFR